MVNASLALLLVRAALTTLTCTYCKRLTKATKQKQIMRSYLHIKGKILWRACTCIILGIVLACCGEVITGVDQPATATVGATVPITVHISIPTAGDGGPDYLI